MAAREDLVDFATEVTLYFELSFISTLYGLPIGVMRAGQ